MTGRSCPEYLQFVGKKQALSEFLSQIKWWISWLGLGSSSHVIPFQRSFRKTWIDYKCQCYLMIKCPFVQLFSPKYHLGAWISVSVSSAFVAIYTVCHPYGLSVKYIHGQWLHLTAEIRLLELVLYQYASLSAALHWLCSHMGDGISNRSVWTKTWVETGLSQCGLQSIPLAVRLCRAKYYLTVFHHMMLNRS